MSNYSDSSFDESSANSSWYKVFHLIPEGSKVLDVGCSSGNFGIELINRKQCIVDGLELDKADAADASKKLRRVFIKNVENDSLDDLDNDYDIIYFGDVIEHLVDPISSLKKIRKHLSSKGKILFSIPNMAHISVRLMMLTGKFEYTETGLLDKTHLHFYTLEEVERVFAESGLFIDHLDFVLKDYPSDLIKKELKAFGISVNNHYLEGLREPGASAFQFVGTAVASNKVKRTKLKQFGPIDMFEEFYNNTVASYEGSIESLKNENNTLKNSLEYLKNHPYRGVYKSVKKKIKS